MRKNEVGGVACVGVAAIRTFDEKGVACGKGGVADGKQHGNYDKMDHTNVLVHCTAAGYLWLIEKGRGRWKRGAWQP